MATKKTTKPAAEAVKADAAKVAVAAPAAKAETKTAAKADAKPAAKKAPAKKPAAKAETNTAAKKAPAKKTPAIQEIAEKLGAKLAKKNVSKIDEKIAIEIKVYGEYEAFMYILINDGKVEVKPYNYDGCDAHIDMPINDALAIIAGGYDFKAKILSGDFYATGSLTKLMKVKEALF